MRLSRATSMLGLVLSVCLSATNASSRSWSVAEELEVSYSNVFTVSYLWFAVITAAISNDQMLMHSSLVQVPSPYTQNQKNKERYVLYYRVRK
jgi:hypothetical protein